MDKTAELNLSDAFYSTMKMPSLNQRVIFWDSRQVYDCYDELLPENEFSDEQALFCPSSVTCFDLVTREKLVVVRSCLRPVVWNKAAFNQLVLPEDKREMISSLLENHTKGAVQTLSNLIPGKGSVSLSFTSLY